MAKSNKSTMRDGKVSTSIRFPAEVKERTMQTLWRRILTSGLTAVKANATSQKDLEIFNNLRIKGTTLEN